MSNDPGPGTFSAEFLRSIIDSLPVMVFVKDAANLRFEFVNGAGEALLGRTRAELIGHTDHDFFKKEEAEFFQAKDREALASTGTVEVGEEPISTPNGVRWLRTAKFAIRDDAGMARHLLGISEDITDKRELEERLRQAQKMDWIGKLAAGVAHDLNNLLSVIMAYSDLATNALQESDPVRDEVTEIAVAAKRAAELTHQLLASARVSPRPPSAVDINRVVTGMAKMLRRLLEENIQLTILANASWPVFAAPSDLEQVLMNLVVNSRDAMARGGHLTLETADLEFDEKFAREHPGTAPGPHVMLSVNDTGSGMEKATRERLFEPLFTTKPPGAGTGLGLWNVYGLVRQMGGTVTVDSEVGKGTTFKVYLPRAHSGSSTEDASDLSPVVAKRGCETVLVTEDDDQLLRAVTEVLRRNGYNVLAANGPAEALLLSEQHAGPIDLLLSDVIMPLLSGQQLAERLGRARPEMKVALMSGYAVMRLMEGLAPGVVLVQKPFSTSALLQKIREALGS